MQNPFLLKKLQDILSHFPIPQSISHCAPIHVGHINDSYWVYLEQQAVYVLQRINEGVFPDPESLGTNLQQLSACMKAWSERQYPLDHKRRYLQMIRSNSGKNYHQAPSGNWRLMVAIQDSISFDVVENADQAYEAGRLFGEFWVALSALPREQIVPTIHRFHDLSWRWEQLQEAFSAADDAKKMQAEPWMKDAEGLWRHLAPTIEAMESGALPQRIVHNDAKLSNALFDKNTHKGLCVIDLDTVMPGYVLYDFGDMVRSMCCPLAEDSTALDELSCDMQTFEALAKGYLEACATELTAIEIQSLAQAGTYMSLIMGMRFLADYLNGNRYYKTAYPDHNLDRARNQITLALDLHSREKQLHSTLQGVIQK